MGTLRRNCRPCDWHENVRRFCPFEGTAKEIWIRARTCCWHRQTVARQSVESRVLLGSIGLFIQTWSTALLRLGPWAVADERSNEKPIRNSLARAEIPALGSILCRNLRE